MTNRREFLKDASRIAVTGTLAANSTVSTKANLMIGIHNREEQTANVLQDNIRYSVCWLGNAGWLLRIGQINVLIDPDLEQSRSRKTLDGIPDDCLSKADAVLITHEHGDHCNIPTVRRLVQESGCRFVLPASCRQAAIRADIPERRIIAAHHSQPIALFGERFTVTPVPAIHGGYSGAVYKHYNAADCGYLVSALNTTLFHPGDSVLLEEHYELGTVDILMVSPTEHNTNVQQSLILIEKINPRYIFPQHRDTYHETDENRFWTHAYYNELADALDERYKSCYHILSQGHDFVIK